MQQVLDQQRIKLAGAEVPAGLSNELSAALRRAIAEAFVDSFRLVIFIAVGLALVSALIASLTLKNRGKSNRTSTQES